MKRIILFLSPVLLSMASFAQNFPYGINYQGVARDVNGNAVATQTVNLRFTITPSTSTTTVIYTETQTQVTNKMGQFNAVIGTGTSAQTFSNVVWQGNVYNLIVEINPGSGYQIINNQKLEAVPYAMRAANSDSANFANKVKIKIANYQEVAPAGSSNGGSLSMGAWLDVTLGTIQYNDLSAVVQSGSGFTLQPGVYKIKAYTSAAVDGPSNGNYAGELFARIYNVTTSSTLLDGSQNYFFMNSGRGGNQLQTNVEGIVNITSTTVIKLQRYAFDANVPGAVFALWYANGLNIPAPRVLSQLMIEKLD